MLRMCRDSILVGFFHFHFLYIKHVFCKELHSLPMYRHLTRKEVWSYWKVVVVEIRKVPSHWNSSLERQNNKASIWTLDLARRKSTEIIRLMNLQSKKKLFIQEIYYFILCMVSRFNESEAETYGGFPFSMEKVFKIAIGFDAQGVQVSINGKFFCEYPYKARLATYSGLKIRDKKDLVLHVLELHHKLIDKNLHNFSKLSEL